MVTKTVCTIIPYSEQQFNITAQKYAPNQFFDATTDVCVNARRSEEVNEMEIRIEGTPKEIAALVLAVQERQDSSNTIDKFVQDFVLTSERLHGTEITFQR